MSRITIHLRKQARCRELDTALASFRIGTTGTLGTESIAGARSHLHFKTIPEVNVSIEETTVQHDDAGNVLDDRRQAHQYTQKKSEFGATEEWFEMRPPEPARAGNGGDGARNRELRFVV
jgi:hypothetical protein